MRYPILQGKAILSPMAGVTDVAFRALCKKYGAALTFTEFISGAALVRNNKKTKEMLETDPTEKPVGVQLFGNNEEEIVAAAKIIEKHFDIIDINCGCPAWKVIKTGSGSALLNNPDKIAQIVYLMTKALSKPVSVKIRAGFNKINAVAVAKAAEKAGASAITVHGRTTVQGFSGKADWEIIKKVKNSVKIPVIGNGDVSSPEIFKKRLDESGVDAIMIGRGAIGNPYIFKEITDYLTDGRYEKASRIKLFFEYIELAGKYDIPFGNIKGHAISFTKGLPGSSTIRARLSRVSTVTELKNIINKLRDC